MKKPFPYRPAAAIFLAALILQVVLWREVHHLFGHHEKAAHCFTNGADTHLHSQEYASPNCQICFFQFSPARLDAVALFIQPPPAGISHRFACHTSLPFKDKEWSHPRRGPPPPAV